MEEVYEPGEAAEIGRKKKRFERCWRWGLRLLIIGFGLQLLGALH